jgi:rhodanese-related sulfurtransferase
MLNHKDVLRLLGSVDSSEVWSYVDVRTPIEFAQGHIAGAYNVPFKHGSVAGLSENPDFSLTMTRTFDRARPLIFGCHSGARAKAACAQVAALGYTTLAWHADSLAGSRDHFGRLSPGWLAQGYEVTEVVEPGRSYEELRAR